MPLTRVWLTTLSWGLAALCAVTTPVGAQPRRDKGGAAPAAAPAPTGDDKKAFGGGGGKGDKKDKVKDFNFNALDLNGRQRTPQLLYFLERANEELERASLEKRSFIPTMVKSVDEEQL